MLLDSGGAELARVEAARGSPGRPLDERELAAKVSSLAGDALAGALDDPERPAAEVLALTGPPPGGVRSPRRTWSDG